jgi:hypothetical protein
VTYAFHDLIVDSDLSLPELPRSSGRSVLSINAVDRIEDEGARWFHDWPIRKPSGRMSRTPWLSFAHLRDGRGFLLRFPDLADFEVSRDGDRVACAASRALPRVTLRHLLLDHVLPLVLHLRGRLALHASAVHVPGFGAIAFAGPAGSGKSTLAAALALRGCAVAADDCLVFAQQRDAVKIVPGYPGVRLWPDAARSLRLDIRRDGRVAHYTRKQRASLGRGRFHAEATPLRAVFVLGRRRTAGQPSRMRALGARDRVMALVPYAWLIDVADPARLATVFDRICDVAVRVPVARLSTRDGRRSLARSADEVLALARATGRSGADS